MNRATLLLIPTLLLCIESTTAQTGNNGTMAADASLTIQSTPESASVVIDGKPVGSTPVKIDSLIPGAHVVVLQHHNMESWLTNPVCDTVRLDAGEVRVVRYELRSRYIISSSPFGAEVIVGDSVVGTTPMTSEFTDKPIVLRLQGYEPAAVTLTDGSATSVALKKIWQSQETGDTYFKEPKGGSSRSIGLYLSGAATILGGAAAAYFKVKADDRYQQYLRTGDSALLSQTHRLDTTAGIAIAATQIGLGLFTYFILSE